MPDYTDLLKVAGYEHIATLPLDQAIEYSGYLLIMPEHWKHGCIQHIVDETYTQYKVVCTQSLGIAIPVNRNISTEVWLKNNTQPNLVEPDCPPELEKESLEKAIQILEAQAANTQRFKYPKMGFYYTGYSGWFADQYRNTVFPNEV